MSGALIVCLKWVALRPEIDPLTGAGHADPRFSGPSPADWSTLEWALRLAGDEGPVHVVTVGPAEAEPALRDALAAGAASAVRIDSNDGRLPSRQVARQLAVAVHACGDELTTVCTGDHSLDRGSGSVPVFLAIELGWPQALGLVSARREGTELIVERRLDQGRRERLAVHGPSVLSFEAGPRLRRASLSATLAASRSPIEVRPPTSPGDDPAEPTVIGTGPFRPRTNVKAPPVGDTRARLLALSGSTSSGGKAHVFEGTPEEAAALAHARLIEWGYLDPPGAATGPASGPTSGS